MAKKLSIIVPVYNAEKYLHQCLKSILSQPIEGMEVLCINDGSTDQSLEILKEIQKEDERVRIIDKPNSGYGDSLNKGISAATGDYIGFVESDDMVVEEKLKMLLDYAEQTDADVVKGNYYLFESKETVALHENFQDCKYGQIINSSIEEKIFLTAPAIWSGIYKRQFLAENNIIFLKSPGASYQDTSFAFKVWACAKKVWLVKDPIIYYRQDNAASSSNDDRKVFDIFNETAEMSAFIKSMGKHELLPLCMRVKFQSYAWTLNRLASENKLKFLIKLYYDVRIDCYEGNLVRKYWEIENWNIIFNIIFNPSGISRNLLGDYEQKDPEPVYSLLNKIGKVYIWEEGQYEENLRRVLQEINVEVIAAISADSEGNLIKNEGGRISLLESADKDKLIVLRTGGEYEAEILKKLNENFMHNYIGIYC